MPESDVTLKTLLIVYHSATGGTRQMAQAAFDAAAAAVTDSLPAALASAAAAVGTSDGTVCVTGSLHAAWAAQALAAERGERLFDA